MRQKTTAVLVGVSFLVLGSVGCATPRWIREWHPVEVFVRADPKEVLGVARQVFRDEHMEVVQEGEQVTPEGFRSFVAIDHSQGVLEAFSRFIRFINPDVAYVSVECKIEPVREGSRLQLTPIVVQGVIGPQPAHPNNVFYKHSQIMASRIKALAEAQ